MKQDQRKNRRRPRSIHDCRTINDRVTVSALADDGEVTGIHRLMILIASASGDTTLSLAELRTEVCRKVIDAGGVEAAIKRQIILR